MQARETRYHAPASMNGAVSRRASAPSRIAMFGSHGLVVHPSDEANEVFPTRRLKLPNPVSTPSDQTYRVQLVIYQ